VIKELLTGVKAIVVNKPNYFCKPSMVVCVNLKNTSASIKKINSFRTYFYSTPYVIPHKFELKFKVRSIADGFFPIVLVKELLIIEYYNNRL